ncbi:TPA: hypothetical protein N3288_000208 [Klebsiella aerogenes]|nr:hypothetical protein [Klebsiella aerogenes]
MTVDATQEFNALVESMGLTAPLLAVMLQCPRSTIFNYQKGVAKPAATAISMLRLLHFLYVNDREKFIDWLLLTEFDCVEAGTANIDITKAYRQGKLRPVIRGYIEDHGYQAGKDKIDLIYRKP